MKILLEFILKSNVCKKTKKPQKPQKKRKKNSKKQQKNVRFFDSCGKQFVSSFTYDNPFTIYIEIQRMQKN